MVIGQVTNGLAVRHVNGKRHERVGDELLEEVFGNCQLAEPDLDGYFPRAGGGYEDVVGRISDHGTAECGSRASSPSHHSSACVSSSSLTPLRR